MADPEHLEILKQGVYAWNKWREENRQILPDLSWIDLYGVNLNKPTPHARIFPEANLRQANLRGVNLRRAKLVRVPLAGADLSGACLESADLSKAGLSGTNLSKADLRRADLLLADLRGTNLTEANLCEAFLGDADLGRANLSGADLSKAFFDSVNLRRANLKGANFSESSMKGMILGANDLSEVIGLETVRHVEPSTVGVDTIFSSRGNIPEAFLRGCGLPESFIVQIPSLVAALEMIQFYSCFISYSSIDQEFADRLHADLQAHGVRVWFAPHDMKIGARMRPTIDESIRGYDKLLLVLSEHSVSSQWVEQEVETALAREREQEGKTVLFPIRIDEAVMETRAGWPALLKNTRNVGDFTRWKEHDSYQRAFDRLLRDLKAGA
jgi:uncharacterized protein YjbI with pentapeptide repeats